METTSTVFCSSDSGFASHMNELRGANRASPTDSNGSHRTMPIEASLTSLCIAQKRAKNCHSQSQVAANEELETLQIDWEGIPRPDRERAHLNLSAPAPSCSPSPTTTTAPA